MAGSWVIAHPVLQVVQDALLVMDDSGAILFANRAMEEMCDFTSQQLVAQPHLLCSPPDAEAFFELVRKVLAGEQVRQGTYVECCNRTSGAFLARAALHPFREPGSSGPPRKRCACVLSQPLFYERLFESCAELVCLLEFSPSDRDCILLRANPTARSFFAKTGASGEPPASLDVDARKLAGFHLDDDLAAFFASCDHSSSSSSPSSSSAQVARLGVGNNNNPESRRWIAATVTLVGVSVTGRRLFALVGHELAESARERELRAAARGQLVTFAKIVHDLRSPLAGMLGMLSLLSDTRLTSEQSSMVGTIRACGDSLLALVGDVLDLSRLESNKLVLSLAPFDLIECVEEALEIASPQALAKDIDLLYRADLLGLGPAITGDRLRVRQVLLNLIYNAINHSDKQRSSVLVAILLRPGAEGGQGEVTLSVEDTGCGLAGERLPHMFEPFSQGHASSPPGCGGGGTGLGLAVVKSIVHLMGGRLSVCSREGEGSTFAFTFPSALTAADREGAGTEGSGPLAGRTALLLFENRALTDSLEARLGSLGMRVVRDVENMGRAHVVLCDGNRLGERACCPCDAPVVVVDWRQPCGSPTDVPPHFFLRKPVSTSALLDTLCRVLGVPQSALPIGRPKASARRVASAEGLWVLIVDDNILSRKIARRLLQDIGCCSEAISNAANGLEAIRRLEDHMVDLVLLDLDMPELGGIETAKDIRRRWPASTTRPVIVALTAAATTTVEQACRGAGMNGFLTKPIRYDSLAGAIAYENNSAAIVE